MPDADGHDMYVSRAMYRAMLAAAPAPPAPSEQPAQGDAVASLAAIVHYPDHWDTAVYPDALSAIREALFSVGCSECKQAAPPAPSVREGWGLAAFRHKWEACETQCECKVCGTVFTAAPEVPRG